MIQETKVFEVLYLSDIKGIGGFRSHMSYSYNGSVVMNKNQSGQPISVFVDGEAREFTKGFSTQGNSEIVFDTRFEKAKFTRIVGKVGINASQVNVGDGADVSILTSTDSRTWTTLKNLGTVKCGNDAIEVDFPLPPKTMVKFKVNARGDANGDHVVFADFKMVEADFVEEVKETTVQGLKRVEEYDALLSKNTAEYNLEHNKMDILRRDFVKKVGYQNVKSIAETSEEYAEAIDYLMTNETALTFLITGGDATKEGSYPRSIRYFCDIYAKYAEQLKDATDNHFNLRLAISTALAFANHVLVTFWNGTKQDANAVRRYERYQELVAKGYMDKGGDVDGFCNWSTKQFKALPIPLMRWVVGNRINDDEIFWLADYALVNKEKGKNYLDAYNYIAYLDYNYDDPRLYAEENKLAFNEKHGNFLNYINDYGTKGVQRLWMVFEEGAVCGGLSKTYHNLATTFGRPSSVMGQPGHASAMTYGWNKANQRYEWVIQNDIYGWSQSGNEYNDRMLNWGNKSWTIWHNASYNILATDAVLQTKQFKNATMLNILANSYSDNKSKELIYTVAVETQPINLEAMEGLIKAFNEDSTKTSGDFLKLAKQIIETYTYYPQVMMEMLALIQNKITDDSDAIQLDILKNNALMSASKATPDKSTNVTMSKQLANKYLNSDDFGAVATFSFDGENAGKIIMNEKYGTAQITIEYSLDGGNNWIRTTDKVIALTDEQLKSITPENDIKVSLVGVDTVHTIDILAGQATTGKVIMNDYENLLVGALTNLEFSLDGGETWCDYVIGQDDTINHNGLTGIRFDNKESQKVSIRYKATGVYVAGAIQEFTFTPNTDTDTKKYVQLRNVKVISASAHQGGQEAVKIIDGNLNSGFHTKYGTKTIDKHVTFEFDKPRYITSMEYVFVGGNNGRMKKGRILASLDGATWETIKEFANMKRDVQVQEYVMDKVVETKFIKIEADETHGNRDAEANMFLACKEVRFFEDTTKTKEVVSPIEVVEELVVPTPTVKVEVESPIEVVSPIEMVEE